MTKKNRTPQVRKRTKPTVGIVEFVDVIFMKKEMVDGKYNVYATCSCGLWRSNPETTVLTALAKEAQAHSLESGHQLRNHSAYKFA